MAPILPQASYNSSRSFFISKLSPLALKILLTAVIKVPDGMEWGIGTFLVGGETINPQPTSSFVLRENMYFFTLLLLSRLRKDFPSQLTRLLRSWVKWKRQGSEGELFGNYGTRSVCSRLFWKWEIWASQSFEEKYWSGKYVQAHARPVGVSADGGQEKKDTELFCPGMINSPTSKIKYLSSIHITYVLTFYFFHPV